MEQLIALLLTAVLLVGCGSDDASDAAESTTVVPSVMEAPTSEPVFWHQACVVQQEVQSAHWRVMEAQVIYDINQTAQNFAVLDNLVSQWADQAYWRADALDRLVGGLASLRERRFGANLLQVFEYVERREFDPVDSLEIDNAEVCFSHGFFPIYCDAIAELHTSATVAFEAEAVCFAQLDTTEDTRA
jgi:hypothetical protein